MTDPQVATLTPAEWQALCHGKVQQLAHYLANTPVLADAEIAAIDDHLTRLRTFMYGWKHASVTVAVNDGYAKADAEMKAEHFGDKPQPNGAAPAKRKGWPKGKPRGPRKAKTQVGAVQ